MEKEMAVSVWGVRGSIPTPEAGFLEYGGNTSCVAAESGAGIVIFDAGSGLARLGENLRHRGVKRVDILLSHLHIDHCLGLFGFRMLYDPEAEIHLYGEKKQEKGFRESLAALLGAPYWPVGLGDFQARVQLHEICPGESLRLPGREDIEIHTLSGNHPGGSLLYRLETGGKSVVYALDCETDDAVFQRLTAFSKDSGLIIWDAGFAPEDLERYRGWGHSSWRQGIALRRAAGAGQALMTHYAPDYADVFLREQERLAASEDAACLFAREGMRITV